MMILLFLQNEVNSSKIIHALPSTENIKKVEKQTHKRPHKDAETGVSLKTFNIREWTKSTHTQHQWTSF